MDKIIKPVENLRGEIVLPGDKSISHRAVLIGGIAKGVTKAKNFLKAEDCLHTVSALRDMGIFIDVGDKEISVHGRGLKGLAKPKRDLYLGNSGTTMRILPGVVAGQDFETALTGDESLTKRPMKRIIEPLKKMGVDISSRKKDGFPPLAIKGGKIAPLEYATKVASAQVKSCILLAGLYAKGTTSVTEPFLSRDHTERMLEFFGAKISRRGLTVSVEGAREMVGKEFFVPGDISSAAFFIAAACILDGSDVTIREIGLNPTRMGFVNALIKMGAAIEVREKQENVPEPYGTIRVTYRPLRAVTINAKEVPLLIDEVPILAVAASSAEGETVIKGISELRVKETDRISSMTENLNRMGSNLRVDKNNLIITGKKKRFTKAESESFKDHRTAMAMAIAALRSDGECRIKDTECVNTSFPDFFDMLGYLSK
ncbi:3-phosphoshikimate 1-carboxyvinyltransferase [Candidatus Omnitrophota bacterium]